jgi:hypothetical protein
LRQWLEEARTQNAARRRKEAVPVIADKAFTQRTQHNAEKFLDIGFLVTP